MKTLRAHIVTIALVVAVLLFAAAAMLVRQVEAFGRAQTTAQLLDTTRALALVVDSDLKGYERALRALAASEAMEREDFEALDRQARAVLSDPDAWIMLADRNGRQFVNTRLPPGAALPTGRLPDDAWRELDTGRPRVCNLAQGVVESQILCVDVPIMRSGRAAYMLSVIFRPAILQRIVDAQHVPQGRYATILDRNGIVIWRNVAPERFVGKPATHDMLSRLKAAPEGTAESLSLDGKMTVLGYSRSPVSGWTFVTARPTSEMAAGARLALRNGAPVGGLLFLAAALAALWGAHRLTSAIGRLKDAAGRIRDGRSPDFAPSGVLEIDVVGDLLTTAVAERDAMRERFDLAQDVGGIGAWDWDTAKDQGHVTDTFKRMHGLEHVEGPLTLSQVLQVIHADDLPRYLADLAAARERPEPSTTEYRVCRPDGSVRWIASKGRPIFGEKGELLGAVGIVRDATAEHDAEDALRRLNEVLERQVEERTLERDRLWNIARDPFVVADDRGVWLAASPAWSAILGYPLEDFIGRTSEWIEHPDDRERTRAEDRRLAQGNVTERFENRFRASDGSYRWFSWTSVPEGGRFYSVARDITAEKEQARALRDAEEALRQTQKMESIGQITGGVAHDFNNLLMPILGTLDLLQQRGLPDARSERMVSNALEAAERARILVQRLLAFARRQPLKAGPVDLADCLRRVEPLLATSLGPRVTLRIDVPAGLPPVVADDNQFEMALLNLVVNAKDAMPDGGHLLIRAVARDIPADNSMRLSAGRYIEVSVADTGVGMPPTSIERAIEPFFSTKGLGRGTGLGLSMVHGLMGQLGGALRIESALGEGTTIHLWLRVSETAPSVPVEEPVAARPILAAGRALVVDDENLVRASTAQMVADLGYLVVEAASADEAIVRLETQAFDLLVTDHLMPGMSGVELARIVRRRWPVTRLLVVSGYADVDDIAPDLPRLSKPFRRAELGAAIDRLPDPPLPIAEV